MRKFWIDCDAGVDDAISIFMMLSDPDVDVIGISTVAGNTLVENSTRNVLRLLEMAGRQQVPVHQGADRSLLGRLSGSTFHGSDGLGDVPDLPPVDIGLRRPEHAVSAMANAIKSHPGEVNLLTLGPLTNVGLALRLEPTISQQIANCYIMGGNYSGEGNISIGAEFNFHSDAEAAHVVLNELQCPVMLICWETVMKTGVPFEIFHQLESLGTKRSDLLSSMTQHGRKVCADMVTLPDDPRLSHYMLADTVAAAVALDPSIVRKSKTRRVKMELIGSETRGQMIVDWRDRFPNDAPKRDIILGLHKEPYLAMLRKALS